MKHCPTCNRVETDAALKFCRIDGARLVVGAPSTSESATMALPSSTSSEDLSTGRLRHPPSIAVLPFVNISNDPENEYFCDGLAEELLNALAGRLSPVSSSISEPLNSKRTSHEPGSTWAFPT